MSKKTLVDAYNAWATARGLSTYRMPISFKDGRGNETRAFSGKELICRGGLSKERDLAWFEYCDVRDNLPPGTTYQEKFHTIMGTTRNGLTPPGEKSHQSVTGGEQTARIVEFPHVSTRRFVQ